MYQLTNSSFELFKFSRIIPICCFGLVAGRTLTVIQMRLDSGCVRSIQYSSCATSIQQNCTRTCVHLAFVVILSRNSSAAGFRSILFQELAKRPITKCEPFPPIRSSAQFRNWIAILAKIERMSTPLKRMFPLVKDGRNVLKQ